MYVVCPGCQSELTSETNSDETVDLTCPQCGCVVDLEHDETLGYRSEVPKQLKQFELLQPVGRGAYGLVWQARDTQLDRIVAVKMPARGELEPREADRFLQEAKAAAQLRHPNIVSVHETGIENGQPYIVSDFIEGVTLLSWLTARQPTIRQSAELFHTISRALHYSHECGIIHRDLKPGNIMIDEHLQPFVMDFGLAKRLSADATIAAHISVLGTPAYMAPEQASGQSHYVDRRCDIYSLGVILFLLLTGEKPFRGNTQMVLHQVMHDDPPSPRRLNGKVPRDLEIICLKCLEKSPQRRYETAEALAEDLRRYLGGEPITARPVSLPERGWRWCRRRPAVAGLLISLFLSLTIGLIGVTYFWRQSARSEELTRQSLYRSQMNLVATYYNGGDIDGVQQTLNRLSEDEGSLEASGFAWRYFDRLTAPFIQVGNQGAVVNDIAVSQDGSMCAACSRDQQVRVWDSQSGELIRELSVEVGRFNSVDFSPDSGFLATGSSDGMIRIWNPRQDDALNRQTKHGPPVAFVRFSEDGKSLLSAGLSGAVRVWEMDDLTVISEIPSGMSRTADVQFLPGNDRLVIATEDGRVRIWDFRTMQQIQQIVSTPSIQALACSDDGQSVVTGSYGGVISTWKWQDEAAPLEHSTLWGRIDDLEFLPESQVVALLANDGGLHLFDCEQQREIRELKTHSLSTGAIARSADDRFLVIGGGNGAVQLARLDGVSAPTIFWHETDVREVEFLAGGDTFVAVSSDGQLRIWEAATGAFELLPTPSAVHNLTVSAQPNGHLIASGGDGPHVTVRDGDSLELIERMAVPDPGVTHVDFSASGRRLGIVARRGPVLVYDPDNLARPLFETVELDAKVNALAFSSDDRRLAIALEDGRIELYDGRTGKRQETSIRVPDIPYALVFCESDDTLAIGTGMGEIHLWNVENDELSSLIKGHSSRISVLTVLRDGTTLVSAGRDSQLRLWDTESGELITTLADHDRQVFSMDVSPDGDKIISGALEGDIRIWNGQPVP